MNAQLSIDFTTHSRLNTDKLTGQNKRLYDWLSAGNTIHLLSPAKQELRIGFLNSRVSDLINIHGINIYKRYIQVKDVAGDELTVVEYSLNPFKL